MPAARRESSSAGSLCQRINADATSSGVDAITPDLLWLIISTHRGSGEEIVASPTLMYS